MDIENQKLLHTLLPAIVVSVFVSCGTLMTHELAYWCKMSFKASAILCEMSIVSILLSFIPSSKNQEYANTVETYKNKGNNGEDIEFKKGQCSSYQHIYHTINMFFIKFSTISIAIAVILFTIGVIML